MSRRFIFVTGMLLAACGTSSYSESQSGDSYQPQSVGSSQPAGGGAGAIPITALQTTGTRPTTTAKIILKSTQQVETPVTVYDGATDRDVPVTCTSNSACSLYPPSTCNLGLGVCTTTGPVTSIFYVKNRTGANLADPIAVPCDNGTYTAEVYGAAATADADGGTITETHISSSFTMTASGSSCAPTGPVSWSTATQPSFVFPTIYVGLGAPYDRYTVNVEGLAYPWSGSDWSLTQGTVTGTRSGLSATFPSPAANGALAFTGLFHLDSSTLLASEQPKAWALAVPSASQTPVASGGVNVP